MLGTEETAIQNIFSACCCHQSPQHPLSPAQRSSLCYLTLNCRREVSVFGPAQEDRQHIGEVGATSTLEPNTDQGISSGVHTTSYLSCCPNLPFSGISVLPHHAQCLWTLEVPLSAQYQPVGHICSHPLKWFLQVDTSLNF